MQLSVTHLTENISALTAFCGGVYITDSVLVLLGTLRRHFFPPWENVIFDFSQNCELRFRLKFHRVRTIGGKYQNFAFGKFFNSKKLGGEFHFF